MRPGRTKCSFASISSSQDAELFSDTSRKKPSSITMSMGSVGRSCEPSMMRALRIIFILMVFPFFLCGESRVPTPHALDILDNLVCMRLINVAAGNVAKVVQMRLFLVIAHAILGHDRTEAVLKAVDTGGAYAAAGRAACHDHGTDALTDEECHIRGLKEDGWPRLADLHVISRVVDQGIKLGTGMLVSELFAHG